MAESEAKRADAGEMAVHDEVVENREKWGNQLDFILSCLGYAVGLGNVWRFPYLVGRNGGAAFMIPYLIMLIFAGFPTFYLELALGQYAALTPHLLYRRMCPIFTGIGYAMVAISFFTGIYYNMIIAWSIYYFFVSFTSSLPWEGCQNEWNTASCLDDRVNHTCTPNQTYFQGECLSNLNSSFAAYVKEALNETKRQSPATQYNDYVLGISDGMDDIGAPQWHLVLCLIGAWILIFFCLCRGIKSSGKVVYFTATFPYVLLTILFFRGITLDGAIDGVTFFVSPNWTKLGESGVWRDAAIQIFFSLSLGGGGLTTLASYNAFNNNLLRDTLIVVVGNCGTSVFAGFVIFPIIGFIAKQVHPTADSYARVRDMAASGPTLAFVAYPDAVTRMPGAPFWAVLFFFMLIILGIDSQIVIVEVVITAILDQWPKLRDWRYKIGVVTLVSLISLVLGLMLTCPGGPYILNLVDTYVGGWPLIIACLVEVCMVSWVYGVWTFVADIRLMLGSTPPNGCYRVLGYPVNAYWWGNWLVCTPLLLTGILIFTFVKYERTVYGTYTYPVWAEILGWLLALFCIMWIPLVAIVMTVQTATAHHDFRWLWTSTPDWGPSDLKLRNKNEMQMTAPPAYENAAFGHNYPVNTAATTAPAYAYEGDPRLSAYRPAGSAPYLPALKPDNP